MQINYQRPLRLPGHNYAHYGYYFITIVTQKRIPYFGRIKDGKMEPSPIGRITQNAWQKLTQVYKNIELDEFIVMPNHIHGIIRINKEIRATVGAAAIGGARRGVHVTHAPRRVPTHMYTIKPLIKNSISSIINHFKGSVTKTCKILGYQFQWQPRFYDHIIRNEQALQNIRIYIRNNPLQ